MGTNDSEEAAEFVATVRTDHVPMKTWYNDANNSGVTQDLQEKYGAYPSLWKEALNWAGWKETRREYLKHTQQLESQQQQQQQEEEQMPRKRKSRWGSTNSNDNSNSNDNNNSDKRSFRSRWGDTPSHMQKGSTTSNNPVVAPTLPLPALVVPGILPATTANLPQHKQEEMRRLQSRLREINDKMDHLEREAARVDALPRGHRERSPSPPPIYGPDGKRKNTRAERWRQRYSKERQDILEKLVNLNPSTRGQTSLLVRKRTKKIRIPIEEHPTYNFIGLIIGPRGKTQKELESKTGCKIAIRGRGSVKEGARGRRDGKVMEGDNEPLHVVITGDDQNAVEAASSMIEQMLVVIDDEKNVHKQQQLRELALLNGTLKEEEYCQVCAEKGHRAFECPRRFAMSNKPSVSVRCAICGDTSHPTRDCTQRPSEQKNQQELDSDYMSFMAELDGKKVEKSSSAVPPNGPAPPAAAPDANTKPAGGGGSTGSPGLPPVTLPLPPPPLGNLPPPPPVPLPPPPLNVALPPPLIPPPTAVTTTSANTHITSVPLPPPPPPHQAPHHHHQQPQHANNYYGSQQSYSNNNNNAYGAPGHYQGGRHPQQQQQGQHPPAPYNQQQQQGQPQLQQQLQQQQQQQVRQVRPGEETTAWDPNAYYGYDAGGGAGGFNWWES